MRLESCKLASKSQGLCSLAPAGPTCERFGNPKCSFLHRLAHRIIQSRSPGNCALKLCVAKVYASGSSHLILRRCGGLRSGTHRAKWSIRRVVSVPSPAQVGAPLDRCLQAVPASARHLMRSTSTSLIQQGSPGSEHASRASGGHHVVPSSSEAPEMDAVQVMLSDFFDVKRFFLLPAYQRPYLWQKENAEAMLSDLWEAASQSNEPIR